MNKHEEPRIKSRLEVTYGSSQNFSDSIVILQDNETKLEYPFATRAAALNARTMILDGTATAAGLVGSPIGVNAYNRIPGLS